MAESNTGNPGGQSNQGSQSTQRSQSSPGRTGELKAGEQQGQGAKRNYGGGLEPTGTPGRKSTEGAIDAQDKPKDPDAGQAGDEGRNAPGR